jgi:tetratricopeptide (TPR) repeat protein/cold shock CspA family protein
MDLPMGLVHALETRSCVLFVGAGVGAHIKRPDGSPTPDAEALARELAERFSIDLGDESPDLAAVAELVELRRSRLDLEAHLSVALDGLEPDAAFRRLVTYGWRAIFTTNYDDAIERSFALDASAIQTPVSYSVTSDITDWGGASEVPIFHLHGRLAAPAEDRRLVITQTDYTRYSERRRMLFDLYRVHYATHTVVYVGYSHRDSNWRILSSELRTELAPAKPPPSYRVVPSTPSLQKEVFLAQGLETIDLGLSDFVDALPAGSALAQTTREYPLSLADVGNKQPVALDRLLQSFQYVNAANFSDEPNTKEFLRGAPPTWSLVGHGVNFERDLEKLLHDTVLEFMTSPAEQVRGHVVLGSAGYGTSTLLMAVAAWLARSEAGPVLSMRLGAVLRPGDVEFAVRRLGRCVFFIDNATDYADEIATSMSILRDAKLSAIFILGDRLNEWRERRPRVNCTEWALEPLSDIEIERLLVALETNHELGQLASLSPELRFSSIQVRNSKELLVTLREVTEGRDFDAIIQDEYHGILDDLARRAYLAVCCFSRARAVMRADVVAKILDLNVAVLYQEVLPRLEGVLRTVDLPRGDEGLVARHHSIATVVWQRCGDRVERQGIALAAMRALNLAFGADVKAFEALTRSDELVDDFASLDARTAFFETALKKDPDSPYVRQHYARMLRRADRPEAALSQIDSAIAVAPRYKNLHHTRGVILRDMARGTQAMELARRRLSQSEEAFEAALNINGRDEYSFQSLAELYLMWAERLQGQLESILYIEKSQEIVQKGLSAVRQKDGLYVVSAKIEEVAGNTPAQIEALRQAVRENSQALVARYLLGTALRNNGSLEESAECLAAGLRIDPENIHLAVSYALTLEALGKPRGESIAVLRQAQGLGTRDYRFVAVLGGMYEMNGDIDSARKVFHDAKQRDWTIYEKTTVVYRPNAPEWRGRLGKRQGGFAFIATPGHNDVFVKSRSLPSGTHEGDELEFSIGFDVRGANALKVTKVVTAT